MTVLEGDCLERLGELDDDSIDAVVTDPPYGLSAEPDAAEVLRHWLDGDDYQHRGGGFMGKSWDSFVPGPTVWKECLRVLKPGGHLVAFFGTRTVDLGGMAIRLAGFEIRDCLAWHYGSGFPKSLDVSKAIDKRGGESVGWFGPWFRQWREENGITQREVARLFPSKTGNLTGCVANWELGLNLPTPEQFNAIVAEFGLPFSDIQEAEREVVEEVRQGRLAVAPGQGKDRSAVDLAITAPATEPARQWQGWGTALKPAFEPIILARKPLIGTVAENVTRYGTGALNVDGCRVASNDTIQRVTGRGILAGSSDGWDRPWKNDPEAVARRQQRADEAIDKANDLGRWPANLILDDQAAAMLDEQSGEQRSGVAVRHNGVKGGDIGPPGSKAVGTPDLGYGDTGGASRFFYQAKASRAERNAGLGEQFEVKRPDSRDEVAAGHFHEKGIQPQKNSHPTVKPIDLMRWLVRLVTPAGGTVLDPFTGSGTTGIAAGLEGFDFVGIEREAEYREIAEARLRWWGEQEGETSEILQRAGLAEKERAKAEAAGQTSLFEEAA